MNRSSGVVGTLDGDGLRAVSRWCDGYGGGLVEINLRNPQLIYVSAVYTTYQPLWEGSLAGYNVIIDLGIFLGEYLITKRPRLYWEIYRGHQVEPDTFGSSGFMKPCLGGMPRLWKPDPLGVGARLVGSARQLSILGSRGVDADKLVKAAKSTLYLSKLPDGNDPLIIGDSSNEPI